MASPAMASLAMASPPMASSGIMASGYISWHSAILASFMAASASIPAVSKHSVAIGSAAMASVAMASCAAAGSANARARASVAAAPRTRSVMMYLPVWPAQAPVTGVSSQHSGSLRLHGVVTPLFVAGRPVDAAAQDRRHLGHLEFAGPMSERRVEDAAIAVHPLPHHRHDHVLRPGRVLAGKRRRCQHVDRGVHVHVVLLRRVRKARRNPLHHRIVRLGHVDGVVDDVARMGDPLPADDELVVHRLAERIAHPA